LVDCLIDFLKIEVRKKPLIGVFNKIVIVITIVIVAVDIVIAVVLTL
jgi:hypothetical protein